MIQDIPYNGYTVTPSDYSCPDGDLSSAINVIPHDSGELQPLLPPLPVVTLAQGERLLCIHSVPAQKNYILMKPASAGKFHLQWIKKTDNLTHATPTATIGTYTGFRDIALIGNTIVLATDDGLQYVLWKDDDYIKLGNRPPFTPVEFGMCRVGTLNNSEQFTIPARIAPGWSGQRGQAEASELAQFTQSVYGLLNPAVADSVTSKGLFYQPFFIRYAYRLFDGTYSWHSAPVLMLPTITPPIVKYADDGTHPDASGTLSATLTLNVNYFALTYRILADTTARLAEWSDIIAGIDIFISAPIYTYDQSRDLTWRPVTMLRSMLLDLYDWNPDGLDLRGSGSSIIPSSVFVGHYADTSSSLYVDHTMSTAGDDSYPIVNIRVHDHFTENITAAHQFYKVAEIDVKDIKPMTTMKRLKLANSDLSTIVTRPMLPDDYQSHCTIKADKLFPYNARLSLSGAEMIPPKPFPIRSLFQFGNPDGTAASTVRITVWTRHNGVKCHAVHLGSDTADTFYNPSVNFPRYIYYPDASAYKMEIWISDTLKFIVNLTPHDFLNGAYYFNSKFSPDPTPVNALPESTSSTATSALVESKIYTSEVNNPFLFPATGICTVGTGRILGLSAATKALSQGQFGHFPLYAFTTEGVWALEVSSTGTYSARQPVTRDVCINPDSITQIDTAVLFATNRGIMMLSGADSHCISASLGTRESPFSLNTLPHIADILALSGFSSSQLNIVPFTDFISGCNMLYDYINQRLIIYNPQRPYAYVYSLTSRRWGMMQSSIAYHIQAYPDVLAVDDNDRLVDFTRHLATSVNALVLTRPLKLAAPDTLKTVDSLLQRGRFKTTHLKTILFGSRDLFSWYIVNSSTTHALYGSSGTPYKYFRVLLLCQLDEFEALSGCTVSYLPRFTNRLH